MADSIDAKLEKLVCSALELVIGAIARACALREKQLIALDVSCGTGLCDPLDNALRAKVGGREYIFRHAGQGTCQKCL